MSEQRQTYCTLCCRVGDFRYYEPKTGLWMHALNQGGSSRCLVAREAPADFCAPLNADEITAARQAGLI